MHLAADYGQLEVLEYLAAQGADIDAKDKHGISVILAAIWEGHSKCVKFLLDKVCIITGDNERVFFIFQQLPHQFKPVHRLIEW